MQTIPSNLNAEELLRWYDSTWNKLTNSEMEQRLADALKEALDKDDDKYTEEQMEKRYESPLEQSEFRAQLLQEILALCDQAGTKVELVKAIKLALENSYVEL